ncbi:MAG: hypothetical protein RL077_4895 [Verrucomicrobiota bacterium]
MDDLVRGKLRPHNHRGAGPALLALSDKTRRHLGGQSLKLSSDRLSSHDQGGSVRAVNRVAPANRRPKQTFRPAENFLTTTRDLHPS